MQKVLIIEDEQLLYEMYKFVLVRNNFEVVIATNGEDGIEKAKTLRPDIILLDIMMPKMNGIQTLEKIKKINELKDIPIIMLSNISDKIEEQRCLSLGAVAYVIKSQYMPQEILKIVQKYLNLVEQSKK